MHLKMGDLDIWVTEGMVSEEMKIIDDEDDQNMIQHKIGNENNH